MKKIFLFILFFAEIFVLSAQTHYYVSPQGQDRNSGTLELPFKTIEKARQQARRTEGDVVIYLREGIYRLNKALVFTPEDGHKGKSLTIRPYAQERSVITGSTLLTPHWKPYKDEIIQATIEKLTHMDLLCVNGSIRHQARYPNYDSTAVRFNGVSADATSPQRVMKWEHPEDGFLHAMHAFDWGDFHYRIISKDDSGNLQLEGGWQNNRQMGLSQNYRMVENIFEELDSPGEWFYDKRTSILYYYPYKKEDVKNLRIESAQIKHLIELRGTEDNPVCNISIEGIEFTQTRRTFMEKYEPLLRSDWTIYRGAAIVFEGTENCILRNCYLHKLGGNAILFSKYNRHSTVTGCHFTQIGASAICFVGDIQAVRSPSFEYNQSIPFEELDLEIGPKNNNYPAECLVDDNLIHSIGCFEKQVSGVELSMCQSITVSHNSIYDTPRAGINVSEGTWGGHIIEYNDVFNTVKETGDHGSFNSWGRDRFWHPNRTVMDSLTTEHPSLILADAVRTTIIRNNRFRCDRGWDIDLDDGSSNYHIYNNLCLNGGIKLREGFYRTVENNILVNNTFHPHVWFHKSGDIFCHNIIMTPYQPINIKDWGTTVDRNIFTDSLSYRVARQQDTDEHSIVYPVHFINPLSGDFSISHKDIAVFRLGFKNFEMDKFGVRSPHLRQITPTPIFSYPVIHAITPKDEIIDWMGLQIKNLCTLGERSATGMDSERGVYVRSSAVIGYTPLKDYINANDAILEVNHIPVNNLNDFWDAIEQTDMKKPIEFLIVRNQRQQIVTIPANIIKK